MITLYARKEPTTDDISIRHGCNRLDTVIYKDPQCTEKKARIPWYYTNCPDRRYKYVTLNCYRWRLSWVN